MEKTVHRPIIVKLLTMSDKNLIFKNAKNLKAYNVQIQQAEEESPYVFITELLPEKFKQQCKHLLPQYKEAREKNQKAVWKAIDGEYTLFVNGKN